ncbi:MAG: hypothetical protein KDI90_01380 [Alphaproteobacteria bacterium]|nr:hypothetical protein [Alphaproteobacteria bacterium]MCB9974089.1 hypothetical protein [Rhodospirillales bacterium]
MLGVLALLLDMLIAALLGTTIFYAMRLYSSLSSFREHRDDFERVVSKLVTSIEQAEQSIKKLRETGNEEAGNLEDMIRHARETVDELRMVNEASGNMANRLEDLAEKNRKIAENMDSRAPYKAPRTAAPPPRQKQEPPAKSARPEPAERQDAKQEAVKIKATNENTEEEASFPSFFIQDREVQESPAKKAVKKEEERHKGFEDAFEEEDEEESPIPPSLQSQAERELFFALQKNKRKPVSGGRS